MIMADKGFQITEELEARQVTLLIPPGRRCDVQVSISKVRKTKKMCSQIDNIIKICCAMTNLKSPMY